MKEIITIANYEAYYLDYLEGTLSDDLVVAFELFLEEHPELSLDGSMEFLIPEIIAMDPFEKEILKKDPDLTTEIGIEVGLIADMEGILEPADQLILQTKKANNPSLVHESKLLALTVLKADDSQIIAKNNLYQKEVVFLSYTNFFRVAGIAALLLIGFFLFNWNTGRTLKENTVVANQNSKQQDTEKNEHNGAFSDHQNNYPNGPTYADNKVQERTSTNKQNTANSTTKKEQNAPSENQKEQTTLNHPTILPEMKDNKVIAIAPVVEDKTKPNTVNQDLALANTKEEGFTPIQYFKNKVENSLEGQVALTTNDRAKGEKKGFFLKLGSMEISHNRTKK